jgi:hypothetical protein
VYYPSYVHYLVNELWSFSYSPISISLRVTYLHVGINLVSHKTNVVNLVLYTKNKPHGL